VDAMTASDFGGQGNAGDAARKPPRTLQRLRKRPKTRIENNHLKPAAGRFASPALLVAAYVPKRKNSTTNFTNRPRL